MKLQQINKESIVLLSIKNISIDRALKHYVLIRNISYGWY